MSHNMQEMKSVCKSRTVCSAKVTTSLGFTPLSAQPAAPGSIPDPFLPPPPHTGPAACCLPPCHQQESSNTHFLWVFPALLTRPKTNSLTPRLHASAPASTSKGWPQGSGQDGDNINHLWTVEKLKAPDSKLVLYETAKPFIFIQIKKSQQFGHFISSP